MALPTFTAPSYTPFQWHDGSSGGTPLNTTDLMAAETSLVTAFQAGDAAVVAWVLSVLAAAGLTFVIRESGGSYAARATGAPGASSTQTVFYIGIDAPTIGGTGAINDVDEWIPSSV